MNQHLSSARTNEEQKINSEQLAQIIEAIAAGKYSWACVLILQFANYNPLHFIPYRTYKRLIKENRQASRLNRETTDSKITGDRTCSKNCLNQIKDLSYQEEIGKQKNHVFGGNQECWWDIQIKEYYSFKGSNTLETFTLTTKLYDSL